LKIFLAGFTGVLYFDSIRMIFLEKTFISLPNGEIYAYLEQGEVTGGETFLLIHGNASSSLHYTPLFNRLSGFRLIAPDMRGFGDSSYNARFSSLAELAEDIKLFAGALGITKAHVAGWSTGGGIALELAVKYPSFVSSIFLIEGVGYKGFPLFRKNPDGSFTPFAGKDELAADPVLIAPALAAHESKNTAFFEQRWNASIYIVKKPGAEENALYLAETVKQRCLVDLDWALITFNMSAGHNGYNMGSGTIGSINCPVTITCAEKDMVVPPETSRENAAAIKGSVLLEYQNCGHSPLVDCPDRLAADILAHVRRHTKNPEKIV
jgi:pimeloyl-ACP methyl ester carboxylesterase